jgi:sterol desaturase/sphingolipid hydroxylase (fatty acid hydroxylase superfamily)
VSARRLASLSLFPLLVGAIGALALHAPRVDLAARLGLPAAANEGAWLFAAVLVFYPLIALLERLLPYRREWNRSHGDVRADLLHLFFSGQPMNLLFQATLLGVSVEAGQSLAARLGAPLWPRSAPLAAKLALAVAVAELGHWAFHRLSHETRLVWRVHATHHSAPRLYWLNATRFTWPDLFALISVQSVPLLLLGIDRESWLAYVLFGAVYGQLQHANLDVRTGPLDYVFSTPGLHRWHHSTDPREGNRNYGAILSIWDLLFGTFFRPKGRAFAGPVGIGALPRFPRTWLAQQLSPFRWRAVVRASRA